MEEHSMSPREVFHGVQPVWSEQEHDSALVECTFAGYMRRCVIDRFNRYCDGRVVFVPLVAPRWQAAESPPVHPVCADIADREGCRESWALQVAMLQSRARPIWHRCPYDRLCGTVPIEIGGECVALLRLVCLGSVPEREFVEYLDLLDVLVRDVVHHAGERLHRLATAGRGAAVRDPARGQAGDDARHPQIARALAYIEEHLSDPKMSVGAVAAALGSHPDYLAHLFSEQTGQRMGGHIAEQRIALARRLLETTDWQIKQVSAACGFSNPNWFSHVFRAHTGVTPRSYRRKGRTGQ
jgi:AraC-like DNA-binding protein